jgi:alkylation response protein AidB-like acyl-CoA dehydrogenase
MAVAHTPGIREQVQALLPFFGEAAPRADEERRLPADVVNVARGAGLFRLLIPAECGGLEACLEDYVEILELIAGACGSLAWCMVVTGGCTHALAVQFSAEHARPWLKALGDGGIVSGTLPPTGTASPVDGGYVVSGRWPFASLTEHATFRMVGAVAPGPLPAPVSELSPDRRVAHEAQDRHLRYCIVPRDAAGVTLHDTWHALTMQGSGSCDIELSGVPVPEEHTAAVDWARYRPDLYGSLRVPFAVVQGLALAAITTGIAGAAMDAFVQRARAPRGSLPPAAHAAPVQLAAADAAVHVATARALLASGTQAAWQRALRDEPISLDERTPWWVAAHGASQASVAAVNGLFALSGAHALYDDAPMQRYFRDVRVAQHHIHLHPGETAQDIGRSLLGLPVERHNW